MDNRAAGKVLRHALVRTQQDVPYPCPDDNAIAAYLDGRLTSSEKVTFEEHASRCGSCRQVVGLALGLAGPVTRATRPAKRVSASDAMWWLRSPIAAAGAAVLVVAVGAALFTLAPGPAIQTPAPQVSVLTAPAEKTKAAPEVQVAPARQSPAAPPPAAARATAEGARAAKRGRQESRNVGEMKDEAAALGAATAGDNYVAEPARPEVAAAAPQLEAENKAPAAELPPAQDKSVDRKRDGVRLAQRASLAAAARAGPSQAVHMLAERGEAAFASRVLDGITFCRVGDYWIDSRCAAQPDSAIVEISPGSQQEQQIMAAAPHLRELMQSGSGVIVRHADASCLLKRKNQDR